MACLTAPCLAADPPPPKRLDPVKLIYATSEKLAVVICRRDGYRYVLPIPPNHYDCLLSNVGTPEAIDIEEWLERERRRQQYE